jgi:excisionase family DNA binding protein
MDITTQGGENLLSTTEAAALLRVTPETVVLLAKAGKIDAFKIGRIWRIRRDSLEAYLDSTSTQSQKPS